MPELTKEQAARRVAALRLATQDGKKWRDLSKEERRRYLTSARSALQPIDRRRALILLARREAKRTGKNWAELTKEQRQQLVARLRQSAAE